MSVRISTPSRASAAGKAPTTSASPPVLTSGKISEATERTFSSLIASSLSIIGWVIRHDAAFGAAEPLGVELRVLADHEALGNPHAAVDDHFAQSRTLRPMSTYGSTTALVEVA